MLLPVYMKLNSGGRAPDDEDDAPVIAEFKANHAQVGKDLKALFPEMRIEKWR
jgi:hypothetical protein